MILENLDETNSNLSNLSNLSNKNRKTKNINVEKENATVSHQDFNVNQENGNLNQNQKLGPEILYLEIMCKTFIEKLRYDQKRSHSYLYTGKHYKQNREILQKKRFLLL